MNNLDYVYDIVKKGTEKANIKANETLKRVKANMRIDYFESDAFLKEVKANMKN